jgi:hypothetical protein
MGGWYNPAGCPTAQLLKIRVRASVPLPFFGQNRDALPGVRIHDGEVLVSVGEIFRDAFREGVERAAEEDVVGGIWHDLHLEIYVNIVESEMDVVEAAVRFGDSGVGGLHLQRTFYL